MTAKPMTPEEIADVEVLALLAPTPRNIRMIDVNILDRLIATARLAPVWNKGTEPPHTDRAVLTMRGHQYRVQWHSPNGWFFIDPDVWCELPTPPKEDEHGAAALAQRGGGE